MSAMTAYGRAEQPSRTHIRSAKAIERRRLLFWLLPPLAWFTVFMLIPYAMLLYTSLGHVDDMRFIPGISLDNFVRVFTVDPYLSVIIKSARIGLMTAILSSIVAYPLAFYLAFHVRTQRLKFLIYLLVIVPWWASYLVKAYAWKTILGSGGILTPGSRVWGLHQPLRLFSTTSSASSMTLTYIFTPFAVLSIYAQLERIPTSLIEVALDAGATRMEIFRKIVFPISIPGIVAGAVITFSLGFGDFVAPVLVGAPTRR